MIKTSKGKEKSVKQKYSVALLKHLNMRIKLNLNILYDTKPPSKIFSFIT